MSRLMRVSVKHRPRWVLWFLVGRMYATIVLICPCVCGCKTLRHLDQGYRQTESCMRTCAHVLYLKTTLAVCVCACTAGASECTSCAAGSYSAAGAFSLSPQSFSLALLHTFSKHLHTSACMLARPRA